MVYMLHNYFVINLHLVAFVFWSDSASSRYGATCAAFQNHTGFHSENNLQFTTSC